MRQNINFIRAIYQSIIHSIYQFINQSRRLRYLLLFLIALVYTGSYWGYGRWKETLLKGDSNGYYMHVVSFFVNQDVGDYGPTIESLKELDPYMADPRDDPYGIRLTPKGRRYIKYTLGVPVLETPFFLLAHAYVKWSGKYKADGWSLPYSFLVGWSTIFYLLIGFNLLIKTLLRYYSRGVTIFVVLGLAFATNLFYQSISLTMAHGFLFFLFSLLVYQSDHFYEAPNWKKAIGLGLTLGMITLTRVPEVVGALVPLLWGVSNWETLKGRSQFLWKNYPLLLWAGGSFLLVFSIQLIYWYYVSGQLVFNPYQGENFNFLRPNIHKGWLHFRNGWLIYTPFMAFSLMGWLLLRRYQPGAQWPIFFVVGLIAYIHYCYYVWAYFPGLGSRPMIDTYPLLAFGLAACFTFFLKKKFLSWIPITALLVLGALNMFQTWQQNKGLIWTERGSKAFYWETLGMTQPTIESLRAFDCGEIQPDTNRIAFIKLLASDDFEHTVDCPVDTTAAHSGKHSIFQLTKNSNWKKEINLDGVAGGDWLRPSIYAFRRWEHPLWDRNKSPDLVIETYDENGTLQKWNSIKLASHITKEANYSIWTPGEAHHWGEAAFFLRLPKKINPSWSVKAYIMNYHESMLYLDDFALELYRKK